MNLIALPAFTDNDIWMLHDGVDAIVVDPEDSAPVIEPLAKQQPALAGILVTPLFTALPSRRSERR
jgi:hydroxyacylglutathione hydrolase